MKTRRLPMTAGNMLASLEKRKTVTRRIVRPQPGRDNRIPYPGKPKVVINIRDPQLCELSPYGKPGDNLALTETWRPVEILHVKGVLCVRIEYRANNAIIRYTIPDEAAKRRMYAAILHGKWLPPMFMQAWASRAPAVVKSIRVERVQGITRADAAAEGVCGASFPGYQKTNWPEENFRVLWDSINGDRPGCAWYQNPWVWAVEYELTAS